MSRTRLIAWLLFVLAFVNIRTAWAMPCGSYIDCYSFFCAESCGCFYGDAYAEYSPECFGYECVFWLTHNRDGGGDCPYLCGNGFLSACY